LRREILIAGGALIVPGLLLFAWKTLVLGLPLIPSNPEGLWRVELEISVRGEGKGGSVRAALPSTGSGQIVDDERLTADRLLFAIRTSDGDRTGVWTGVLRGVHNLVHGFRVQLESPVSRTPPPDPSPPPEEVVRRYGGATASLPATAPDVASFLLRLDLRGPEGPVARARTLLTFVTDEVELARNAPSDALLALAAREADDHGKVRLLATLLRGSGIPARVVQGLRLRVGRNSRPEWWVEAWLGGWTPMSPTRSLFGRRPKDVVALHRGDGPLVEATGLEAVSYRYRVMREDLRPDELAAVMVPSSKILAAVSLYRLPVATQRALRVLLVVPLGALLLALLRNVVGIPTFGTFLPVLLALALRESALFPGLGMLGFVIVLGFLSRLLMDRRHLLLVPRLCIILCVVVLTVGGLSLVGQGVEARTLFAGVLLPIVILTMLIERFSIMTAEEGLRAATVRLTWSAFVAVAIYPLFHSRIAAHLFFGFPELILVIMGILVWLGAYTGYRLTELVRFRSLARADAGGAA